MFKLTIYIYIWYKHIDIYICINVYTASCYISQMATLVRVEFENEKMYKSIAGSLESKDLLKHIFVLWASLFWRWSHVSSRPLGPFHIHVPSGCWTASGSSTCCCAWSASQWINIKRHTKGVPPMNHLSVGYFSWNLFFDDAHTPHWKPYKFPAAAWCLGGGSHPQLHPSAQVHLAVHSDPGDAEAGLWVARI